jgi:hypothetical protein
MLVVRVQELLFDLVSVMRAFVVDLDLDLLLLLLDHLIMSTSMEPPTKIPLWDLLFQSAVVLSLDWKLMKCSGR